MKDVETAKHAVDAASVGVVASTFIGRLPSIATALTVIWMLIRIWETKTVRWWLRKWRK